MARRAGYEVQWPLHPPYRSDGGTAWIADLPGELREETDSAETPRRSRLRLLEDGRELGPPHALHSMIQDGGDGRYSFWSGVLYFSASDGSDPNRNGRAYTAVVAEPHLDARTLRRAIDPAPYEKSWPTPEQPLRVAIIGLGNRGRMVGRLVTALDGVEIAALADRSPDRIAEFCQHIAAPSAVVSQEAAELLALPQVDAVFVTVPDYLHREVAEPAFAAGKHVFLEKPLATTMGDARAILAAWRASGKVLQLGYVLRGAPFYRAVRNVVRQGRLGPIRVAALTDQLEVQHGASYRRRWHGQSSHSGGLIVHKACHDLDLVCWLLETRPSHVSSFGGVDTFCRPAPADYCSQCPEAGECLYVDRQLHEQRTPAERADPTAYGLDRCVFRSDIDIVDNQVVSFELANGVRGTFALAMQGPLRSERRIMLIGDKGRLDGVFEDGSFTLTFNEPEAEPVVWTGGSHGGHGGGDVASVMAFLNACLGRARPPIASPAEALAGLAFALAAEASRKSGAIVSLNDDDFRLAGFD
ncbi:MAG: Gfo/Idh/MocA family protein [Thiohalocapsa sp.]